MTIAHKFEDQLTSLGWCYKSVTRLVLHVHIYYMEIIVCGFAVVKTVYQPTIMFGIYTIIAIFCIGM